MQKNKLGEKIKKRANFRSPSYVGLAILGLIKNEARYL